MEIQMKVSIISRISKLPVLRSVAHALSDRRGVTALEYGILAAVVAAALVAAAGDVSSTMKKVFTNMSDQIDNANESGNSTGT